jgi:hypothetical protein
LHNALGLHRGLLSLPDFLLSCFLVRADKAHELRQVLIPITAQALNDAGYTVQLVLKQKMEVDWMPEGVKELLWRTAQLALIGKQSTTELNKQQEIELIYERINRHLGEKFGLHVPFPSHELWYHDEAHLK